MGKSVDKRFFTKKEIYQKWCEVQDAARQYASCQDDDEQLQSREMQLRYGLKLYLKMIPPFLSESKVYVSEVLFRIRSYACDPGFEPLSADQELRLKQTMDQIVQEPRNWRYFKGWRKKYNKLKKN